MNGLIGLVTSQLGTKVVDGVAQRRSSEEGLNDDVQETIVVSWLITQTCKGPCRCGLPRLHQLGVLRPDEDGCYVFQGGFDGSIDVVLLVLLRPALEAEGLCK